MPPATLTVLVPSFATPLALPMMACPVHAGFPSPADDYLESQLDLNEHLISHPAATFFVRVAGDSMTGAGIHDGDLLIVDKAAEVTSGCVVVASVNGDFTVKRVRMVGSRVFLVPDNEKYQPIEVTEASEAEIWGRVTSAIRRL